MCIIASYLDDDEPVGVGIGKFLQFRGDHFARAAPSGVEIDQHEEIPGGFQFGIEVSLRTRENEGKMRRMSRWRHQIAWFIRAVVTIHLLSFLIDNRAIFTVREGEGERITEL